MALVGLTFAIAKKAPPYREALRRVGLQPVDITPDEPRRVDGLSGLVLSGGHDYGEDGARDRLETACLREAIGAGVPVLGICRGLQLMNRVLGGQLLPDIPNHRCGDAMDAHAVFIAPDSRLARILGQSQWKVNSRHHQALDPTALAPGLRVTAHAEDGVIEAAEWQGEEFLMGVQWHPEDRVDAGDLPLFEAFAEAVRRVASVRR
ncbi:MAG: gamma-glutamyl-gamma-aminobutyrate hydrolase family protein [Bryobacteraceae bacterium]|nr:gamma-glutamyl-gamma-aminobutyrate hydrolase family protein [Bryobacteraceae bacterium]